MTKDLKGQKLKDVDFQAKLEELYRRVNLAELVTLIDLDRLTRNVKYPTKGAASLGPLCCRHRQYRGRDRDSLAHGTEPARPASVPRLAACATFAGPARVAPRGSGPAPTREPSV